MLKVPDKPFDVSNRRVSLLLPFQKPANGSKELPKVEFEERLKQSPLRPVDIKP
jgi:hypothetical protein